MKGTFDLRNRLGISALALRHLNLEEAIETVWEQGFRVFELVPQVYGGPERFDDTTRIRLREELGRFELVTIHSSVAKLADGREANIAGPDPEHRLESIHLYLSHIQLAMDIGAKVVTFHPGNGAAKTSAITIPEDNFEFAHKALERTTNCNIQLGYECFDLEFVKKIGQPRFGILFDIGHAAMRSAGDMTSGVLPLMEQVFPYIVQFHVHGVQVSDQGAKKDHQPLQVSNGIDYERIIAAIKGKGYTGPIIFEIGVAVEQDAVRNLRDAVYAREKLVALWE